MAGKIKVNTGEHPGIDEPLLLITNRGGRMEIKGIPARKDGDLWVPSVRMYWNGKRVGAIDLNENLVLIGEHIDDGDIEVDC